MKTRFRIFQSKLPLTSIRSNPFFTPTDLRIKKFLELDSGKFDRMNKLIKDFGYLPPVQVWTYRDRKSRERVYYILHSPEYLRALQIQPGSDSLDVPCQVICCPKVSTMKTIAIRLQTLEKSLDAEPFVARCLSILYYQQVLGYTPAKLREIYGIQHARSAEGKQLERDRRLVRHPELRELVLGDAGLTTVSATPQSLLENILRPKVHEATLNYALALDVIAICQDDLIITQAFSEEYKKYLERLKFERYPEEVTQPPYKWHHYKRSVVLRIAQEVARNKGTVPVKLERLAGWDHSADVSFGLKVNKATGDVTLPSVTYNLRSKDELNLKTIEHLLTVLDPLVHSLRAYWFTISPTAHGASVRRKGDSLEPDLVDVYCNTPDYFDYHTFKGVWDRKSLAYCNREWFLRSLDLRAHYFGFSSYEPDALSSYAVAYVKYSAWYKERFEPKLDLYSSGDARKRPRWELYIAIQEILMKEFQRDGDSPVTFRDFFKEVFSEVLRERDIAKEHNKEKAGHIMDLDRDIKRTYWDRINVLTKKSAYTEEELSARVAELLLPEQDRLQKTASNIMAAVSSLTKDETPKVQLTRPYPLDTELD